MAAQKSSYISLDDLAKGNTSPLYQASGVAQQSARIKGADKDNNQMVDADFLEQQLNKGTVGLWSGLTAPEQISVVAVRPQGSETLANFKNESDVMLDKIMPVVMPMLVSWGFGSGLSALAGTASGSLGSSAIKAGTSQAVNSVAQGGSGFDFNKFLMATLLKTNFKSGG